MTDAADASNPPAAFIPSSAATPPVAADGFDYLHSPTWRIFRILSEFVDGFTFLAGIQRSVTFFGSARLPESDRYYQAARELGRRLAAAGFTIVTGGGPGIMQAGNQGAAEGSGPTGERSVGLNIQLPHEQRINPYVRKGWSFHYFFSRKVMLDYSAEAYVFFPGGFGTLDEFFELTTLIQTGKMERTVPIVLIGGEYWAPLIEWMRGVLLNRFQTIAPADLGIWTLTDDLNEAVHIIEQGVQHRIKQRVASTGREHCTPDEKLNQATHPMSGSEQ
jgi:hypothetical protein